MRYLLHFLEGPQVYHRKGSVVFWERIIECSEQRDVRIVVDPADVHVEVVRDGALHEVGLPVAHSVILIAKVGCNHHHILVLLSIEFLEVPLGPGVHYNWAVTLVTNHDCELVQPSFWVSWEGIHLV